jgi:hypothetical protein
METESEGIGKILRDAFDAALKERNTASDAFDEILHKIPSGMPHPDGVQRIKSGSAAVSAARDKMIAAMIRLREYENRRIVPEDLKKSAQSESGAAGPKARFGTP